MHRITTILTIAACAAATASATGMNRDLRPRHAPDARISVTLENKSNWFRDVMVDGHRYTVMPGELLALHAPPGTTVYAASAFGRYHSGDAFLQVAPALDHTRVTLN